MVDYAPTFTDEAASLLLDCAALTTRGVGKHRARRGSRAN